MTRRALPTAMKAQGTVQTGEHGYLNKIGMISIGPRSGGNLAVSFHSDRVVTARLTESDAVSLVRELLAHLNPLSCWQDETLRTLCEEILIPLPTEY